MGAEMEQLRLGEKPLTKKEKVENLLKSRGLGGATNAELNQIMFRYGSVIHELRKNGHHIIKQQLNNNGLFRYIWMD